MASQLVPSSDIFNLGLSYLNVTRTTVHNLYNVMLYLQNGDRIMTTDAVTSLQGRNVTSAAWQVTLCDPMWHVSSYSGVATLRTAIHLILTYLFYVLATDRPCMPSCAVFCWSSSRDSRATAVDNLSRVAHSECQAPSNVPAYISVAAKYAATKDQYNTHTHTHLMTLCPGLPRWAGTTKVKPIWILLKQEWQWHQLGHMQVCTSLQTGNHASTSQLSFLQAGCPSCHPTNSAKALKARTNTRQWKNSNSAPNLLLPHGELV